MKILRQTLASLVTLLTVCLAHAADTKPVTRVIAITEVETDDSSGYASWVSQANAIIKAKTGVDTFYHVYVTNYDGTKAGSVRLVSAAESVSAMAKLSATLNAAADPAYRDILDHYRAIRKNGGRVLYQGVRFEGSYKGAYVYSTTVMVSDEANYLKSLDGLRAVFDAKGFKDAKISVYRVLAGRTDHTHRVSISVESNERLAALLDMLGTDTQMAEWLASAAKFRTVVANTTSHDIIK